MSSLPGRDMRKDKKALSSVEGKSGVLLAMFEQEMEEARNQYEAALRTEQTGEVLETAKLGLEIAERRRALFFYEHDSTGAWKGDRLWRDLGRELGQRSWERDAEGQLGQTIEDERSHLLLINMGELDRLNASGDHALGDLGLRLTAERIETVTREVLGSDPVRLNKRRLSEAYDLYRYSGNSFALSLRDVDEVDAEEIKKRLTQSEVKVMEETLEDDGVPLTASRISRVDGINLLNGLDTLPSESGLSEQQVLIGAMLEKAQTLLDIELIETRAARMVKKIRASEQGDLDPMELAKRQAAAQTFYNAFYKKSLSSAFHLNQAEEGKAFEAFRRLIDEKHALDIPPSTEWTHFVAERSLDSAFEHLQARRAVGRQIELKLAQKIAQEVLQRTESVGSVVQDEGAPPSTSDFEMPQEATGKIIIQRLRLEREHAEALRSQGKTTALRADLSALNEEIEKAKRDERTGLLLRRAYFETMEEALARKRSLTTIAIDMAFLRYFDREGGPKTGDIAIAKSAEILDGVARAFSQNGVEVEAYRVGGDEFALTIVGGDAKLVTSVLESLETSQKYAGRVPGQPGAKSSYVPEVLQFNYGLRTASDADSFRRELEEAGIVLERRGTPGEYNELADYVVRLADKEVEIHKGVNRMMLLVKRTLEANQQVEKGNVEMLTSYSEKAIYDKKGRVKIAEFVKRLEASENQEAEFKKVRSDALSFVLEEIDTKNTQIAHFESSLDYRLKDVVRVRYFINRIASLEEEIAMLHAQIEREKDSKTHLEQVKAAAEEEKTAIMNLRDSLQNKPVSERSPASVRRAA